MLDLDFLLQIQEKSYKLSFCGLCLIVEGRDFLVLGTSEDLLNLFFCISV